MTTNNTHIEKIRVLIADDSFFIRTYIEELLRLDGAIEVVGTASTGDEVVERARILKPDVITMDYHMPGRNGIEATAAIMLGDRPLPAIIMLSAFAGDDGEKIRRTLQESGAHVLVKPSGEISLDIEKIGSNIVEKIKEIGFIEIKIRHLHTEGHHDVEKPILPPDAAPIGVLVIGASTGGPPLIEHLLAELDPNLGIAVIIVQHMSVYFTQLFAERLNRVTRFHVREAKNGDSLHCGTALVVPGGHALVVDGSNKNDTSFLIRQTPEDLREVEIDNTMIAILNGFKGPVVGVLLSGMGADGADGLRAIKERGGLVLVQDPETATVGAMPLHGLQGGGEVVKLEDIAKRVSDHIAGYMA